MSIQKKSLIKSRAAAKKALLASGRGPVENVAAPGENVISHDSAMAIDQDSAMAAVDGDSTMAAVDGDSTMAAVDGDSNLAAVDGDSNLAAVDGDSNLKIC